MVSLKAISLDSPALKDTLPQEYWLVELEQVVSNIESPFKSAETDPETWPWSTLSRIVSVPPVTPALMVTDK